MNEPFISCSFIHASTWGNDRVQIAQRGSIVHNLKSALARSAAADGKGRGAAGVSADGRSAAGGDAMRPAEAMTDAKSDDEAEPRRTDGPTTGGGYAHGTATEGKKAAPTIWSKPPCQRICLGKSTLSPCRDLVAQEHSPCGAPRCRQGSPAKRPIPRAGPPEPRRRNRSPRGPRHQGPPRRRQPTGQQAPDPRRQPAPRPRPQRTPRPRQNPHPSS